MSGFFKNKNLVISISLVLIVVLIILSMDVYSRNSLDKNGKQLGYYDTFRNVFGFSPIVENADEVLDTVKETVKDTINDIVDDIKLPKLVPVTPKIFLLLFLQLPNLLQKNLKLLIRYLTVHIHQYHL